MLAIPNPIPLREIDELDRAIVDLSARINSETYELLVLVREFDERAGWLKWGFTDCASWLHWRCDLSVGAAREKVRVAHALKSLRAVSTAFQAGELSYSKVRALVRVANRENEDALVDFALKTTAAIVEERCRELRCGTQDSLDEANRAYLARSLTIRRDARRGMMTITVELPMETGELVDAALDRARDDSNFVEFGDVPWAARQADALVAVARSYLSGEQPAPRDTTDNYLVNIHVDHTALANNAGRSALPVESVRRLSCDAEKVTIVDGDDGEPLSVGRKTRVVPAAIRRALRARDKGCTFPGCRNSRFVDAHHVRHWSSGGETRLDNLLLLCSRHHRLVHEGGYRIDKDVQDRWIFRRPDGIAVPACGYRKVDRVDDEVDSRINDLHATPRSRAEPGLVRAPAPPD
ncbi:MAG TPA: DUF222 domain-containing protein [Woeseiaceae bacterium]|nr:DUF222 domain-containing protein [Woeseiaceae bacterium]